MDVMRQQSLFASFTNTHHNPVIDMDKINIVALQEKFIFIGNAIKQMIQAFSCAPLSYDALGKFGEHSRS